jgi:beta-hydroxylase
MLNFKEFKSNLLNWEQRELQSSTLQQLYSFVRYGETQEKLINEGILDTFFSLLNSILFMDKTKPETEYLCSLILQSLSKLSDEEKYTPHMVDAGLVKPIINVIIFLGKTLSRKYASRTLYHISESAFLRDQIPLSLNQLSEEDRLTFRSIWEDPFDHEEREYWDELLQNTDIHTHQYKPGKAWYDPKDFSPIMELLESHFADIKQEAITHCIESTMVPWPEKFLYKDGWNVLGMYAFQNKLPNPCNMLPKTNAVLEQIPGLQTALFSSLKPRCHIKPHVGYYQYSEKILRVHMGLVVPPGCIIKVNGEERTWEEGKCIIFDDTFRHEVWNPSHNITRIVLMLDIEFKGNVADRNQEFYAKSARQAEEFGTEALISRDLIDALVSFGAPPENSNFQERPIKYL